MTHRRATSTFRHLSREEWTAIGGPAATGLQDEEIEALAGIGDAIDADEVQAVLVPLANYLRMRAEHVFALRLATAEFLGEQYRAWPFIIGVVGSVGVGKSTLARLLQLLVSRAHERPTVEVVSTDSFLFPNEELERRGILHRKGFPESYDHEAMIAFLEAVRAATPRVEVPVYSHLRYDVVPGEVQAVDQPQVLILEGLNLLQPPPPGAGRMPASDLIDLSIYVDADEEHIHQWFIERFLAMRETLFTDPDSFFHEYAGLSVPQAVETAERVWRNINGRNLRENVAPSRERADLILHKGADHEVAEVYLRMP